MATKKSTKKPAARTSRPAAKRSKKSKLIGLQPETRPFLEFRFTRESFYWVVLGVLVIFFTLWTTQLQSELQAIYDKIDTSNAAVDVMDTPKPDKKHH
jgi:hypothetical protein